MYRWFRIRTVDANSFTILSKSLSTTSTSCNQSAVNLFRFKLRSARVPDAVQSPRLTPQMVTSILRMNEELVEENNGPVKFFVKNHIQANKPIEDSSSQGRLVHGTASLFGIYDGHGGRACSYAVSDRILNYIAVALADHRVLKDIHDGEIDPTSDLIHLTGACAEATRLLNSDLAGIHRRSLSHFASESMAIDNDDLSIKDALVNAFLRLDKDIMTEAAPSNMNRAGMDLACYHDLVAIAFSGAVSLVAYVDGTDLFVANAGDCRAVLGVHNDNRWEAVPMSVTHDADNSIESDRMKRLHPNEFNNVIRNRRLFGELIPLRAFGNARYKWPKRDLIHLQNSSQIPGHIANMYGGNFVPHKYQTPPYLDAEPEVRHHHLTPKDKFLVIASDGLWEALNPQKVVELVAGHMEGQQVLVNYKPGDDANLKDINCVLLQRSNSLKNRALDSNAATHLLRSALGPDHGQVSAQLTLPQSIVRFYRDDITITIIYFDSDYIKDKSLYLR